MRVGNQLVLVPPADQVESKPKPAKKKVKTVRELHAELFPCPHNPIKTFRTDLKRPEEEEKKKPEPLDYSERFAAVMGPQSSQAELFRVCGLPIVEATLSGRSTCLFAYGQTGSGKTFSMYGAEGGKNPSKLDGLVPGICAELFRRKQELEKRKDLQLMLEASLFEVQGMTVRHLPTRTRGVSPARPL